MPPATPVSQINYIIYDIANTVKLEEPLWGLGNKYLNVTNTSSEIVPQ